MTCPICGEATHVVCCRSDCEGVYRYRRCKSCSHTFFTTELESDGEDYKRINREIVREHYRGRKAVSERSLKETVNLLERNRF